MHKKKLCFVQGECRAIHRYMGALTSDATAAIHVLAKKFSRGTAERYAVAFCAALIDASAAASEIFQNLYTFEPYNYLMPFFRILQNERNVFERFM